jgi:hypothetical protein
VEIEPGIVIVLPDWMLDARVCAGMNLGTPQLSVDALRDLHRLLLERGFRRSSPSDVPVAVTQENQDDRAATPSQETVAAAVQNR